MDTSHCYVAVWDWHSALAFVRSRGTMQIDFTLKLVDTCVAAEFHHGRICDVLRLPQNMRSHVMHHAPAIKLLLRSAGSHESSCECRGISCAFVWHDKASFGHSPWISPVQYAGVECMILCNVAIIEILKYIMTCHPNTLQCRRIYPYTI